jgi:group I intron endonuclease
MYYIYTILNQSNYKIYVGQTTAPKKRWSAHKCEANSNRVYLPIHKALKKYGTDNFQYCIVDVLTSQDEANIAEEFWIEQFDSRGKGGYNLAVGGNSNSGWHHSEETKKRIAESNTGISKPQHTEEWKEFMSSAMTGRKITWKQKISESQTKFNVRKELRIVSEYENGVPAKKLGEKYGCSTRTIFNIIDRRKRYSK